MKELSTVEARKLHTETKRPFSFSFSPDNPFARLTIMGAFGNIHCADMVVVNHYDNYSSISAQTSEGINP